jgi:hypothetical protein
MSEASISDLFNQDVLEKPHTEEELNRIIEYLRQQKREQAEREAKGLRPHRPLLAAQVEARERKAALKAKGIDPKQLSLLDAIAVAKPDNDPKGT